MFRTLCVALALGVASGNVAARWPDSPVADEDGSLFLRLQKNFGVKADAIMEATLANARKLASEPVAPSYEEIATFNIILFVSIGLVFIFYFASMALVNMEHTNDSLLYSKSKTD